MNKEKLLKLNLQYFAGEEKNYKASTGVDEFYYGVLDEKTNTVSSINHVKFLQDIEVAMTSEIARAHGDNKVAELGVSQGPVTVSGNFHSIPQSDKDTLLGLEVSTNGLSAHGSTDNPPYVVVVFAKTYEDGSKEYVGLPKGKFLKTSISGQSKQGSTTFSQDPISAEFMDREVTGFKEEKSVVTGRDAKAENTKRDALFQAVFGQAYPSTTTTTSSTTTTTTVA
ncbi:hypothetical protein GCM10008986_16760 [Salinibacillus aidingensis]|uniref:Phage major tail protein, phi13 family n=1 Tax=Salinibacillus aidingensis TaxID=237684 RepID=A0ABN1B7H3_9BACI